MADTKISALTELAAAPATTDELAINDGGVSKKITVTNLITFTLPHYIPCQIVVPEGTVGLPDVHALVTASAKVSGAVFPDGASASTYNFKPIFPLPEDLHSTPDLKAHFELIPFDTEATNINTRFTASSFWIADGENLDQALTAEAEETVAMPTTIENTKIYTVALDAPTIAANDTGLLQLKRDPVDAVDVYANSVQCIRCWLTCDRSVGA